MYAIHVRSIVRKVWYTWEISYSYILTYIEFPSNVQPCSTRRDSTSVSNVYIYVCGEVEETKKWLWKLTTLFD